MGVVFVARSVHAHEDPHAELDEHRGDVGCQQRSVGGHVKAHAATLGGRALRREPHRALDQSGIQKRLTAEEDDDEIFERARMLEQEVDGALGHLAGGGSTTAINLGTGRGYSVLEMVAAAEKASGREIPCEIVARRPGDIGECFADPSLSERALGWKATRDLEQMAADACRAGKDVYVEKPMSLTIDEGKIVGKVVKETGRVVQVGTQQRSEYDGTFLKMVALARGGRLGPKLTATVELPSQYGRDFGPFPVAEPPGTLNWDMWLGQVQKVPYCARRCHGSWRNWVETGYGPLADWGVHHVDIAHWGLGLKLHVAPRVTLRFEGRQNFTARNGFLPIPALHHEVLLGVSFNLGRTGEVMRVLTKSDQVLVKGVNLRTKHVKPTQTNPQGGIITKEAPIHLSNVSPVVDGKATRTPVSVVQRREGRVLIDGSLDAGGIVVVEGTQRMRDGIDVSYDLPGLADERLANPAPFGVTDAGPAPIKPTYLPSEMGGRLLGWRAPASRQRSGSCSTSSTSSGWILNTQPSS
mgnify:CR=1 FL=1